MINSELVNNELLSTIVFSFLYCNIIYLIVKVGTDSIYYLLDSLFKKIKRRNKNV